MRSTTSAWLTNAGWSLLVVVILLVCLGAVTRALDVLGLAAFEDPETAFHLRYRRHPRLSLLHIVPGTICLIIGPLQFVRRIRTRYLRLHRLMGRIYVTAGAVAAMSSIFMAHTFPALGGTSTTTATYLFGTLLLSSLSMAVWHVVHDDILHHREWMIRSFALMLGAATVRLTVFALMFGTGRGFVELFSTGFWLGFTLNLVIAEMWIHHTQPRHAAAPYHANAAPS